MVVRSRLPRKGSRKKVERLVKVEKGKSGSIEFWIDTVPNPYGFGRDYTLVMQDAKSGKERRFWMGQDVKVFSRILGMDMEDAVPYYSKKARSKEFDKLQKYIAEDILKSVTIPEEYQGMKSLALDPSKVRKVFKEAEDWSFAVQ
jgi:hypothetical protein